MKQTFEKLAESKSHKVYEKFDDEFETVVEIKNVVELLKQVREATMKEIIKKSDVNLYIKGHYKGAKWRILKDGDVYNPTENDVMSKINKKSILQLDKNSIEI